MTTKQQLDNAKAQHDANLQDLSRLRDDLKKCNDGLLELLEKCYNTPSTGHLSYGAIGALYVRSDIIRRKISISQEFVLSSGAEIDFLLGQ